LSRPTLGQVLAELKSDYLKQFPKKLSEIQKLTESKNFAQLAEEYHKLKGTGKTYGFPEISVLCEHMEFLSLAQAHQTRGHEEHPPDLFPNALRVLEMIYQQYVTGRSFDLQQDAIAKSILAVPAK
jgi:HPt (histidine-containing phosphotransfer) domain-containing protein